MVEITTEMQKCLNEMSDKQKLRMFYELTKYMYENFDYGEGVDVSLLAEYIEDITAEDEEKAKVYTCAMTKTLTFNIKANSMEEAQEWCDTHDFIDVQENIGSGSWDMEYCDTVSELESNGYIAIDITE